MSCAVEWDIPGSTKLLASVAGVQKGGGEGGGFSSVFFSISISIGFYNFTSPLSPLFQFQLRCICISKYLKVHQKYLCPIRVTFCSYLFIVWKCGQIHLCLIYNLTKKDQHTKTSWTNLLFPFKVIPIIFVKVWSSESVKSFQQQPEEHYEQNSVHVTNFNSSKTN